MSRKQTTGSQKWAEELNKNFPREGIQIANRHMKKCSTSLFIREMHTKTTMRYHLIFATEAIIKKTKTNMCVKDIEKREF